MRCRECDYPLWNLATRQCPECGRAFKPSDEEFAPNQVRFCCPHCDIAYFGTTRRGHLEPAEFDCVKCGEHVHMDEMVLRPAEGVDEAATQPASVPWIDRRNGIVRAWFAMIGRSMTAPGDLGRGLPSGSSIGQAWGYAALTWVIINVIGIAVPFAVIGIIATIGGDGAEGAALIATGFGVDRDTLQ